MFAFILLIQCKQVFSETSTGKEISKLCDQLTSLDNGITQTLTELPTNEGENLIRNLTDYNNELSKLEDMLITHRQETLACEKAVALLKEGSPDYFSVNINRNATMDEFGWQPVQMDRVWQLRAASVSIWSRLNRQSRLIPLEYYTYPENETYVGYQRPNFPPIKEKMNGK